MVLREYFEAELRAELTAAAERELALQDEITTLKTVVAELEAGDDEWAHACGLMRGTAVSLMAEIERLRGKCNRLIAALGEFDKPERMMVDGAWDWAWDHIEPDDLAPEPHDTQEGE